MGISRSASTVAAYLIQKLGHSKQSALNFIKERRPIANPNEGFLMQLTEWEGIVSARLAFSCCCGFYFKWHLLFSFVIKNIDLQIILKNQHYNFYFLIMFFYFYIFQFKSSQQFVSCQECFKWKNFWKFTSAFSY